MSLSRAEREGRAGALPGIGRGLELAVPLPARDGRRGPEGTPRFAGSVEAGRVGSSRAGLVERDEGKPRSRADAVIDARGRGEARSEQPCDPSRV